MNSEKIAKILYALSLDMDYADGIEFMDYEVEEIAAELDLLKEIKCDSLIQVLEVITGKMKIWKVFMMILIGNVDIKEDFKSTIL